MQLLVGIEGSLEQGTVCQAARGKPSSRSCPATLGPPGIQQATAGLVV